MRSIRLSLAALALACGLSALAQAARACDVPLFRYAIERWPAAAYEAVVFHHGPLDDAGERAVAALAGDRVAAAANVIVTKVDLGSGKPPGGAIGALWRRQKGATTPWLVVRAPHAAPDTPPVYAGPPDAGAIKSLVGSPARREIVSRLLAGESAVWVLLECGDRRRDDEAAALLADRLKALQKDLPLPRVREGRDAAAPPGPRVLSKVPLEIRFSVLRVSPAATAETRFVDMLREAAATTSERRQPPADEPLVLPVFGRGRALCGLAGRQITAWAIKDCAAFLVGACSCRVKELSPGVDLLLAADWDSFLDDPPGQVPESPAVEIPDPVIAPGKATGAADE